MAISAELMTSSMRVKAAVGARVSPPAAMFAVEGAGRDPARFSDSDIAAGGDTRAPRSFIACPPVWRADFCELLIHRWGGTEGRRAWSGACKCLDRNWNFGRRLRRRRGHRC